MAQLTITITESADLPGQWVGHCLDYDVVSQGNSIAHALAMVGEAVEMVVAHDLASGRDPTERRAPAEAWAELPLEAWAAIGVGTMSSRGLTRTAYRSFCDPRIDCRLAEKEAGIRVDTLVRYPLSELGGFCDLEITCALSKLQRAKRSLEDALRVLAEKVESSR